MTLVQSIATVSDFYVPVFELRLRGRPVAKDVIRDVISVTYKDNIAEIDSFEVVINNWEPTPGRSSTPTTPCSTPAQGRASARATAARPSRT